jgi:hypothetical protein
MMDRRKRALRAAIPFVLGFAVIIWVVVRLDRKYGDFVAFYNGAWVARTGQAEHLYDLDFTVEQERRTAPALGAVIPSNRPAFYYVAIAPLSLLPYDAAWGCWVAVQMLSLGGCWLWGLRRFGNRGVLMSFLYPPAVLGIAHGQDAIFMLAIVLASYSLAVKKRSFASGVVLGLALIKPHLVAIWPLALIVQRRWRMLAGFAVSGTAALAAFVATTGPQGLLSWMTLLRNRSIEAQNPAAYRQINAEALSSAAGLGTVGTYVLSAALVVAVLVLLWKAELWRLFALAITTGVFIAPHALVYDYAAALLPLWLAAHQSASQWTRSAAFGLATPIVFTLIGAPPPLSIIPALAVMGFIVVLCWGPWGAGSASVALSGTSV